jgi:release factor glutamine methyltransferase
VGEEARGATVGALLGAAERRLREAGVPNAAEEAEILVEVCAGVPRAALALRAGETVAPGGVRRLGALLERRERREPLQHLLGSWPFLELDLLVDGRALVPRPETEDVALRARSLVAAGPGRLVVDAGTGGGCLALALAAGDASLRVLAVDVDAAALELARENLRRTGLAARVGLVRGDLLEACAPGLGLGLVVANLPYVREEEWDGLAPEVRLFDPPAALVGGADGLGPILRLLEQAPRRLVPGGALLVELAPWQADEVAARLRGGPWQDVAVVPDRFGRARMVEARRAAAPFGRRGGA